MLALTAAAAYALGLGTPRLWRALLGARERRWRARPGVRRVSQ